MQKEENMDNLLLKEKLDIPAPGKLNKKILIFGLPAFIVQLLVVYFITANLLITKTTSASSSNNDQKNHIEGEISPAAASGPELGKYIFQIEDIIVNPADTEGKKLLLTSIGFDVEEENFMQEYKSKEVLLKDIIVTTLSSKSLNQLCQISFKDSIKAEIYKRVK